MSEQSNGARRKLSSLSEAVASRLWPIPAAALVVGVVLGVLLPQLDQALDEQLSPTVAAWVFSGGVDAARAVLTTISGSLITATSLIFSLTVVALQLASSQASPRLLRMFAADAFVHWTLATFLGTFAFALVVLRTVSDAGGTVAVPRISVTFAVLLTIVSMFVLTLFLGHLARILRVETMLRDVHDEVSQTIDLLAADRHEGRDEPAVAPADRVERDVVAHRSGFITSIERGRLIDLAEERDLVVREHRAVGSSVIAGTPIASWWAAEASSQVGTRAEVDAVDARIRGAISISYERTPRQDIGYGVRQMADIATKALSPGVNDPTTAVHALSHLAAVLADLAELPPEPATIVGSGGRDRLVPCRTDFADLVETALEQPRRYGAGDPDVVARLYGVIGDVAWRTADRERVSLLRSQLERLTATVLREDYDDVERARFAELEAEVRSTLDRAVRRDSPA
ncbi:DUF2254 domain-containing protein [Agromyces sp. ZXT2-6]|uniref:DUF2254 domain-containing protein n=1 Tax=Agromyces sp. ZXT2-6 TaxID=3461153 RepID=UPI004054C097